MNKRQDAERGQPALRAQTLQPGKQEIQSDRQQGRGYRPRQDHIGIVEGNAAKNKFTETAGRDIGGQRTDTYIDDRRGADTRHDHRERQGPGLP